DDQAQGAGDHHRLLAGGVADEAGNPLTVSIERLLRRWRLWPPRRGAPLFSPRSRESDARAIGDARRAGSIAVAARADPPSCRGAEAQPARIAGDGRD